MLCRLNLTIAAPLTVKGICEKYLFNNICIMYYKEISNTKKNFVINNTNILEQIEKRFKYFSLLKLHRW
jgi:hypothetical protein